MRPGSCCTRRTRVAHAVRSFLSLGCVLVLAAGCYGFAGGGLPPHVKTAAVLPFDNETAAPELPRELQSALQDGLQSRLGLRQAPQDRAGALVTGRITRYEIDIPVAFSANPAQATSARRRLRVHVDIEIVDQVTGKVLWSKKGMQAEGEYAERGEPQGRKQAIDRIVNDVIEGAQSQW